MKHLAILGPGLLGGSLALAVRQRLGGACRVTMWARREAAVEEVLRAECCDLASTELKAVVDGADTVVLCVPIGAMPELARRALPWIGPETLVTDVGSVKGPVVSTLAPLFSEAGRGRFVGSHPMAGSEQAGLAAARATLFEGSVALVTPEAPSLAAGNASFATFPPSENPHAAPATASPETVAEVSATEAFAVKRAAALWRLVGCEVRTLSPEEHDDAIGLVSHLPHLVAAALVDVVAARNPAAIAFCGNGLRDTTRIASGHPEMWAEIVANNHAVLKASLDAFIARLREISQDIAGGNDAKLREFLTHAKDCRDRLIRRT